MGARPGMLGVVNAPQLMHLFERLLGGPAATFDHKWLRVVRPHMPSGAHADIVVRALTSFLWALSRCAL